MRKTLLGLGTVLILLAAACDQAEPLTNSVDAVQLKSSDEGVGDPDVSDIEAFIDDVNAKLAEEGTNLRLNEVEYFVPSEDGAIGKIVFAKSVGNKQLSSAWVKGDPRRDSREFITYAADETEGATLSGLAASDTEGAIDRAIETWNDVSCSTIPLVKTEDGGQDLGVIQFLFGLDGGGSLSTVADIQNSGFLSEAAFESLFGPGTNVIAWSPSFVYADENGRTDIDNDKKFDRALNEVYYNQKWAWALDGGVDVESIALHEFGHSLGQAHFGTGRFDPKKGTVKFSPTAVMNASYTGVRQELTGTDIGGHCSIMANS